LEQSLSIKQTREQNSERAKPEQSGDAKLRVLTVQDGRAAEEMKHVSWIPAAGQFLERSSSAEDWAFFYCGATRRVFYQTIDVK